MENPFLAKPLGYFDFDYKSLTAGVFVEAFDALLPLAAQEHETMVTQTEPTFESLFESDEFSRKLGRATQVLGHLTAVASTPELRQVEAEQIPAVFALYQELALDIRGYEQLKRFMSSDAFGRLTEMQTKIARESLKAYEREGIQLGIVDKKRLGEISARIEELKQVFDCNLTDFNDASVLVFAADELAGVPPRALGNAIRLEDGRYEITAASGCFNDIALSCTVEATRKAVYEMGLQEGVAEGLDNREVLVEIIGLYQERARILGFESHAAYALADNMVNRPDAAYAFSRDLADRSLPFALKESAAVIAFGTKLLGREPAFHDISFVCEKMRVSQYSVESERIRKYFPVRKVVSGLFGILESLFAVKFVQNSVLNVWHNDVQVFDVVDAGTGAHRGTLFLDLFMRKNKEGGAWMSPVVSRHETEHVKYSPVVHVVCNAPKDLGQEPTFEFQDITTLFHEMGHALHCVLSDVTDEFFSGLERVQHDAVELPSQFMENFCWDYEVLKQVSSHIETGAVLPEELFNNLKRSREFMAAAHLLSGARFSILDMQIYSNPGANPFEIEAAVAEEFKTRARDPRSTTLPHFGHIFSGGYSAGYYAYQWAEMLSSDAFAALKEQGSSYPEQAEAAARFRTCILAAGGLRDMAENFKEFRGRAPELSHMLKDYGLR